MKERPILFSGDMVRALLDGRKTQTRRIIRNQPTECGLDLVTACGGDFAAWQDPGLLLDEWSEDCGPCQRICPYGQPGDRLWVRESIEVDHHGSITTSKYCADGAFTKADAWPWQRNKLPSIHCPRGLSRITLEITGVRVERLQDISEEDAIAEGIERTVCGDGWRRYADRPSEIAGIPPCKTPRESYHSLWESINGAGSWEQNPFVWVVEFRRVP